MKIEKPSEELLVWLREQPELLSKLDQMRRMEADAEDVDFDRIELEMLELVKSMGASSLGRCVQGKEAKAFESAKSKGAGRIHSKKTEFHHSTWFGQRSGANFTPRHWHDTSLGQAVRFTGGGSESKRAIGIGGLWRG